MITLLSAASPTQTILYLRQVPQGRTAIFFIDANTKMELRVHIFERATRALLSCPYVFAMVKSDFRRFRTIMAITRYFSDSGDDLAYNLLTLRKPVGIVLSLLLLAGWAIPSSAQQHSGPARVSRLPLIIPFKNASNVAGTDWISESFPGILSTRFSFNGFSSWVAMIDFNAFDRSVFPSDAKPSRIILYQLDQNLDADYLVMGKAIMSILRDKSYA